MLEAGSLDIFLYFRRKICILFQKEIDEKERRERLDAKARAWTAEKMDKNWKKLFPMVIGPIWQGEDKDSALIEKLMSYRVRFSNFLILPEKLCLACATDKSPYSFLTYKVFRKRLHELGESIAFQ